MSIILKAIIVLFILLQVSVVVANAQVTPAPLRSVSSAVEPREIDLLRFDFQEIYFGFEGPNYSRMNREPPAGAQLIADAELFRPEAVRTARFEFVDAAGRNLGPLFFTKNRTDVWHGGFAGVVDVPAQPFRVRVTGVDVTGKAYSRTYKRLFRPTRGRLSSPPLPPGVPANQAASLRQAMETHDRKTRKKLVEEGRRNPDGTITLPRVEIFDVTYEPFLSNSGNVIGLRLRYAVRVSQDDHYSFFPLIWPMYANEDLRGKLEMQVLAVNVDPLPEGVNPRDAALQLRWGGSRAYRAGRTYRFVVDTIPNFAVQNASKTRYCIMPTTRWRALVTSDPPAYYDVQIGWATFKGRTEAFAGPGVFYRSFVKEGAPQCSEGGNINF